MNLRDCNAAALRSVLGPEDQPPHHFADLPVKEQRRWRNLSRRIEEAHEAYVDLYGPKPDTGA